MGGKKATSTSQVTIPPEVLARYNAVNARAETAANTPFQAYGNTASDFVAQINDQQRAGISDINATAGSYQPYMTQATQATQAGMGPAYEGMDNYMSPYIRQVADATGAYMRQQQEQAQSGALGTAAMSGAFGGDRAGIAAANLQQQNQMGYGKTMADILNQGYTQALGASQADLARQMQGGAQMAGLGAQSQQLGLQGAQAKMAAGTMEQQTDQAGKDALINSFMQEKGYPFQTAQFLANIALGTGTASGSTTTSTTPRSVFGFASGGGVSGPRSYAQSGVGADGYVPAGDLPVGQLMIANPPQQEQKDSSGDIMKMLSMAMGAARGGVISPRHGYATDGFVPYEGGKEWTPDQAGFSRTDPLFKKINQVIGTGNTAFNNLRSTDNPGNMGIAGHQPAQMQMPEPRQNSVNLPTMGDQPDFRGPVPQFPTPSVRPTSRPEGLGYQPTMPTGGPDMRPEGALPGGLAPTTSLRPMPRPSGIGYQPTMPTGGPDMMPEGAVPGGLAPTTSLRPMARPVTPDTSGVAGDTMEALGLDPTSRLRSVPVGDISTGVMPDVDTNVVAGLKPERGAGIIVGNTMTAAPDGIGYDMDRLAAAFRFQESGSPSGNYGVLGVPVHRKDGSVDRAHGAYGIMGSNIPQWTKEILGYSMTPEDFINNPSAQDTVAKAKIDQMYKKYGNIEDVASVWFSGRPMNNSVDPTSGKSVPSYVSDVMGKYYKGGDGSPTNYNLGRVSNGVPSIDGLGGADMARQSDGVSNADKPYADRNFIGKFFHNKDGSINSNSILSLLSGIGGAAQAQTISPLGALLAGVGAGADTYRGLQKQSSDIALQGAQTSNEAVQLLKNSVYYDANIGMSLIPLAGGGTQSLADFVVNPAGPSMAGPAADAILRSIVKGADSRGIDLSTATPDQIFSGTPQPSPQAPVAGMPVPAVITPYESFGTFPIGDAEKSYIAQAETRSRLPMTQAEREASTARSEDARASADSGTAASSLAFRNTNELAATVAKAAGSNNLGPLGSVIANYEGIASQVAGAFGIQYDGSAATSQALLNKLSSLSADQMTADTAAASLYLQNKNIFPDITSNAGAAAEITAEMLTRNMFSYEKGQYVNDLYRAQRGVVKDLTGADAMFNKKAGSIYQGEKTNISDLLKYAGNENVDPEVRKLVVDFFDSANRGDFKNQADAQSAIESIFTVLPGQHSVSSGLGRYFVQSVGS